MKIDKIQTADGLQDAAEFEKKHYSKSYCRKVYEKYKHLDPLIGKIGQNDDMLLISLAEMWDAIKKTVERESKC